jgi:formate-nitrite transporter family protein
MSRPTHARDDVAPASSDDAARPDVDQPDEDWTQEPKLHPDEGEAHEHRVAVDRAAEKRGRRLQQTGAPAVAMLSADEIFHRVSVTADHEFQRTPRMLWFSGLAAGLSIGLSFLSRVALGAATGQPGQLPGDLLFPLGFLVVVLGRYQLFTENTLTPVTLVLTRIASVPALLRLWGVVYAANLVGATVVAWLLAVDGALPPDLVDAGRPIVEHLYEVPVFELFVRSILAGGLIASMVWLIHAVTDSSARVLLVYLLILIVPLADLFHCISETTEVMWGVFQGLGSLRQAVVFTSVVTAGNIVGGVVLVATINYGQTHEARLPDRDYEELGLTWREFLFGWHTGRRPGGAVAPELDRSAADG